MTIVANANEGLFTPGFDPVERARKLRPLLAEHAEQCDRECRVPEPVIRAIRDAGLFDMMKPVRAGGPGCTMTAHMETIAELGKSCAGTAWVFGLLSGISGTAAGLSPAATEILFDKGDELFCSVSARTGHAYPVEGGYRVTGSWAYSSGCLHSRWAMNGVDIVDGQGKPVDTGFAILSLRSDGVEIRDTWHVLGVRGSGSNTVVAEQVFVPEPLMLPDSRRPDPAALLETPGLEARDRWPLEPLFPLVVLSPMLGAAAGMLEIVSGKMGKRRIAGWDYASQADSQAFTGQLGEAAMEIDSAWLHVRRAAHQLDVTAQKQVLDGAAKARIQADCGYAMLQLRRAGEKLMDIAGPAGFASANPLQRLWRDLSFGSRHTALNSRLSLELYGRSLLDRPSNFLLVPDIRNTH